MRQEKKRTQPKLKNSPLAGEQLGELVYYGKA